MCRITLVLGLFAAALLPTAHASERLPGPIPARVERIVDGDTIDAKVLIWIGQEVHVLVRIRGIDAAETAGRCESERLLAAKATAWLAKAIGDGSVLLTDVSGDKFGGRVLAEVWSGERNLGRVMLEEGLARPYAGGRRGGWCD